MQKISDLLEQIDKLQLKKVAFIPNPEIMAQQNASAGGAMDPAMLQQLGITPEMMQQMMAQQGLTPEMLQQMGADPAMLQQLMGGAAPPATEQAPAAPPATEQAPVQTPTGTTDLDNTKVTVSLRELLDLVSNGKASQSQLKVKEMMDKAQQKQQATQEQAAVLQQKQVAMAQQGAMMDPNTGIYPQAPLR